MPLPVVFDHRGHDRTTGAMVWRIEATVALVAGVPTMTSLRLDAPGGLDPAVLQRSFRFATPLDVVRHTVPALLARGIDPFTHEYPTRGYPAALELGSPAERRLSDEFLEQVVREYLAAGRGYARAMALERGVTERTIVSWIEKARRRGILTSVRRGQYGGRLVPAAERGTGQPR